MQELFRKLEHVGLTPNALYVLYCIHQKVLPKGFVHASLELRKLQLDGWVNENSELTEKSIIFVSELENTFKKPSKKVKSPKELMGENYLDKIQEYNEIFPKGKLNSGKLARVNVKTLENSFKWFFENYEYSWETIIKATRRYVEEYSRNNYEYMRTSQYFIRKQNVDKTFDSDLATYCDMINDGFEEEDKNYFRENVV